MFKNTVDYSVNKKKYNSFNEEIARLVPTGSRVLDVGCATGKLAKTLKRQGCRVTGIDIDKASLRQASRYCEKVIAADADNLASFGSDLKSCRFDVITMGDILEHLKHPGVLLNYLRQYLKPNGFIVASVPNSAFIWMRYRFLLGNLAYNKGGGLMDEDHLRFFSFATIQLLFQDAGYEVVGKCGSNAAGIKYKFLKYLAYFIPTLFAIHIVIQARPGKNRR